MSSKKFTFGGNISDGRLLDEWVARCGGRKGRAAITLGVSPRTLSNWYRRGVPLAWRRVIELKLGLSTRVSEAPAPYLRGTPASLLGRIEDLRRAMDAFLSEMMEYVISTGLGENAKTGGKK